MTTVSDIGSSATNFASQTASSSSSQDLGQQDFLQLMTAQLQNQDPFAPMENGEFLAQMAQFSTVSGLEQVNATLSEISSQIGGGRLATASSMLGQQVLVPGTTARPDSSGTISGVIELPDAAANVTLSYLDASTGTLLHQQDLGAQRAGSMDFSWSDVPAEIQANHGAIRVAVNANLPPDSEPAETFVFARVVGVDMPGDGADLNLRVEDYGLQNSLEITAIR